MREILFQPIGVIHSPFKVPEGTPIQSSASEAEGTIEIYPELENGLSDVDGFSHIILIYYCHMTNDYSLMVKPYMDDVEHGVFATRSPRRPNSIGLSIVELIKMDRNILMIKGVDIIDGTPLLDIKPCVPEFDSRRITKIGWLENKVDKLRDVKDDGRFTDS